MPSVKLGFSCNRYIPKQQGEIEGEANKGTGLCVDVGEAWS